MTAIDSNIWYADETRANSTKKILFYTDIGKLEKHTDCLYFKGQNTAIRIQNITRVFMARPALNWVSYLLLGCGFAMLDLIFGYGMYAVFDSKWILTKLYILLAPLCALLFWLPAKWVVVEYQDRDKFRKAFFSLGDLNGIKGLFGGNKKLMRKLKDGESLESLTF